MYPHELNKLKRVSDFDQEIERIYVSQWSVKTPSCEGSFPLYTGDTNGIPCYEKKSTRKSRSFK
jgi:hypothetical protein